LNNKLSSDFLIMKFCKINFYEKHFERNELTDKIIILKFTMLKHKCRQKIALSTHIYLLINI